MKKHPFLKLLNEIQSKIPVVWDRYNEGLVDGKPCYNVFGWIARSDGRRDFLMVNHCEADDIKNAYYLTSSSRYSQDLSEIVGKGQDDHLKLESMNNLLFKLKNQ